MPYISIISTNIISTNIDSSNSNSNSTHTSLLLISPTTPLLAFMATSPIRQPTPISVLAKRADCQLTIKLFGPRPCLPTPTRCLILPTTINIINSNSSRGSSNHHSSNRSSSSSSSPQYSLDTQPSISVTLIHSSWPPCNRRRFRLPDPLGRMFRIENWIRVYPPPLRELVMFSCRSSGHRLASTRFCIAHINLITLVSPPHDMHRTKRGACICNCAHQSGLSMGLRTYQPRNAPSSSWTPNSSLAIWRILCSRSSSKPRLLGSVFPIKADAGALAK